MKVRKAIKRIAALSVGATMMGATLMGAMAADLSEYPEMFIEDGNFNGLLVVGQEAQAIDTIGVTNIALGLQKAAVTKTLVCGGGATSSTSVSGEQVKIRKTGEDLNLGENLSFIQSTALDDGDLPSILADGDYNDNEGETDNDVTYTQEIDLLAGSGNIVFDQDDQDAPEAGIYLLFPKNKDIYRYTLEFDDDVEYTDTDADQDEDLESTTLEIQGQRYTITEAEFSSDVLDKLTFLVGESVMWLAEGETVTKEVDGVDHTIKMIDVANNAESCGFEIDGANVWIDIDDTETISGITLGVTEAREVNVKDSDADICKVFIGASELVLEEGKEVEIGGDDVEGSDVAFTSSGSSDSWSKLDITFDPDEDMYLSEGDEMVDPVFGNFKFIYGGEVATYEEMTFDASSNKATFTFMNFDEKEVEIPFAKVKTSNVVVLGDDPDLLANADEGFYLETESCSPSSDDVTDCVGAQFLAVETGDVAHVIEIASMGDLAGSDPEIDFDDITYGTSTDNVDYGNASSDCTGTATEFFCDFDLGSGVGDVRLTFNTTSGDVEFTDIAKGLILTQYEGELTWGANTSVFAISENNDETNAMKLEFELGSGAGSDDDKLEIIIGPTPTTVGAGGVVFGPEDEDDNNDNNKVYRTNWGSELVIDDEDDNDFTLMHPEEQLFVEAFVAETGATTQVTDDPGEGCQVSETPNEIPSTVSKFDTEVTNPGAQNLIAVGGPCANAVTSSLLGDPEVCYEGFEAGKAMLKLVESGSNVALIVAGGEGSDTRLAATILQDYEDYDLSGMEMVATTVSASGLKVEPVS